MTAPDLTEARDLAAMWKVRAEAAEAALDAARAKTSAFAAVLRAICRADRTRYDHHQRRAWDGRRPAEEGGDIWRSPREMAAGMLRRMHREGLIAEAETLWDLSEATIAERLAAPQAVTA